jgi:hypothetical protein
MESPTAELPPLDSLRGQWDGLSLAQQQAVTRLLRRPRGGQPADHPRGRPNPPDQQQIDDPLALPDANLMPRRENELIGESAEPASQRRHIGQRNVSIELSTSLRANTLYGTICGMPKHEDDEELRKLRRTLREMEPALSRGRAMQHLRPWRKYSRTL